MQIERMITISTAHISEETEQLLIENAENNHFGISVYSKDVYGFWIYVPNKLNNVIDNNEKLPDDLWNCIMLAINNGCTWLCLDRDGEIVDGLETFDW